MTLKFFDNITEAFKQAQVATQDVDAWLEIAEPEPEARALRRANVINEDGTFSQWQLLMLHRQAKEVAGSSNGETPPPPEPVKPHPALTPELEKDIPEAVTTDMPDIAAEIKRRVGIVSAVRKWGKPQDSIKDNKNDGVKIRCPFSHHEDHRPSAWVNTSKNVWHCGKCGIGGDAIDFYAARKYDLEPDQFHRSSRFHAIAKEMGEELGYHVRQVSPGNWEMDADEGQIPSPLLDRSEEPVELPARSVPPEADSEEPDPAGETIVEPEPVVPPSPESTEPVTISDAEMLRGVAYNPEDIEAEDDEDDFSAPREINWRDLPINPGSFLGRWMQHADDWRPWAPPEFYIWLGFQAVGLAMGHSTQSLTGGQTLSGSLMISIIGSSGSGKSTAVRDLRAMFNRVGLTQFVEDEGTGIKQISNPASGEALVGLCRHEIADDVDPTKKQEVGITTWMYVDELADFASKAGRRGGANIKTNLLALYDFVKTKDEMELVIDEYALGSGRRVLHDTFFSATFTTQTDAIRMLMTKTDLISGFLNRIVPVTGIVRQRRKANAPQPTVFKFDDAYETLWRRCRDGKRIVPFTDEAFTYIDNSPIFHKLELLAEHDSLFARVQHLTYRLALILAVNNGESQVDEMYVVAASNLVSDYVVNAYNELRRAVIATEYDDAAQKIVDWARIYYDKTRRWPTYTEWAASRVFRTFDSESRKIAMETLHREYRLIIVKLKKEGTRGAPKHVMVVPTGHWGGFVDQHMKVFIEEEFYS